MRIELFMKHQSGLFNRSCFLSSGWERRISADSCRCQKNEWQRRCRGETLMFETEEVAGEQRCSLHPFSWVTEWFKPEGEEGMKGRHALVFLQAQPRTSVLKVQKVHLGRGSWSSVRILVKVELRPEEPVHQAEKNKRVWRVWSVSQLQMLLTHLRSFPPRLTFGGIFPLNLNTMITVSTVLLLVLKISSFHQESGKDCSTFAVMKNWTKNEVWLVVIHGPWPFASRSSLSTSWQRWKEFFPEHCVSGFIHSVNSHFVFPVLGYSSSLLCDDTRHWRWRIGLPWGQRFLQILSQHHISWQQKSVIFMFSNHIHR